MHVSSLQMEAEARREAEKRDKGIRTTVNKLAIKKREERLAREAKQKKGKR